MKREEGFKLIRRRRANKMNSGVTKRRENTAGRKESTTVESLGMKAMLFIGMGDKKVDTTSLRYNRVGVAFILCRVCVCGKESTGSKYRAKLSGSSAREMHI